MPNALDKQYDRLEWRGVVVAAAAKGAMRSREGNDRRRLSVVDDSRDFMIGYIEGESEEEGGESRNAPREGTVPPACTYFGLYASKMNSVIRRCIAACAARKRLVGRSLGRSVCRSIGCCNHPIPTPRPFKHGTAESLGLTISVRQATVAIVVSEVMVVLLRIVPQPATRYTVSVHRAGQRTADPEFVCPDSIECSGESKRREGGWKRQRGGSAEMGSGRRVVPGCKSCVPMIFLSRSLVNEKSTK
ncbi:hypothetical protein ALC60_03264 [Trachymyrmex zeteki]|uniref:Uncharacterized protein n=1 Tax=Mycetomoellerius zeteki TaxID=64791 RepID=A0A151XBL8_9HYME|nr:hypothetical protein ALC60_03264 [Trachymyrmex zeteki]